MLDRLKRDGLVAVVRCEPQPRRPDRLIYAITADGRDELERWLGEPSPPAVGYRDDLYLKLVAAVLRREREVLLGELHALRALPPGDALATLLTEGAALQVEARLRLLELAEDDAGGLVASGGRDMAELVRVDDAVDGVHGAA